MRNILKIVFVIIGTLVGAGFASGKEIYYFFFIYGKFGIWGICVSSFIIGLVIYNVFMICEKNMVYSYNDFYRIIFNKKLKRSQSMISQLFCCFVNIFLLIMFYVMISGFSSFLYQEFNINKTIGILVIIGLCFFTFIGNINKLIKLSNYFIPILIFFIIIVSFQNIDRWNFCNFFDIECNNIFVNKNEHEFIWIIKSILYASYNCIVLIPVLVQLYSSISKNKHSYFFISLISMIIICVLSFAIFNLLLQGNYEVFKLDMPVVAITKQIGEIYGFFYSFIIGIAIFTSAASSGVRFFK